MSTTISVGPSTHITMTLGPRMRMWVCDGEQGLQAVPSPPVLVVTKLRMRVFASVTMTTELFRVSITQLWFASITQPGGSRSVHSVARHVCPVALGSYQIASV